MGYLIYDRDTATVQMEDRTLAHLQIVMINKMRRHESFTFSWKESAANGDGRGSVWIHPTVSLMFKFAGSRPPAINPQWLQALTRLANSGTGLHIVAEPFDDGSSSADSED